MFTSAIYFFVLIAACSSQTVTPTDPSKPANISGIFFRFYNRTLTDYVDIPMSGGVDLVALSIYDKSKKIIMYIQSWLQNAYSDCPQAIVQKHIQNSDTNVAMLDWSNINTNLIYPSVAAWVSKVAAAFAKLLCDIIGAGVDPEKIELVGFSLGAHAAGHAGYFVQQLCYEVIHRITALDPSLELFYFPLRKYRAIDKYDANQTVAIVTSAGQYGAWAPSCKVVFYVNKGTPIQPGCDITSLLNFCDHKRSCECYVDSIGQNEALNGTISETDLIAAAAANYKVFSGQPCEDNAEKEVIYMGDGTGQSVRGIYYLTTNSASPFGKGLDGLCV